MGSGASRRPAPDGPTPMNDQDLDDLFEPANDNEAPDPLRRRVPRHVDRGRTDLLLALAGFHPHKVPRRLHAAALRVAWCFEQGLFDPSAIARACSLARRKVAKAIAALEAARTDP